MATKETFEYVDRPWSVKKTHRKTGVNVVDIKGTDRVGLSSKRVGIELPRYKQLIANRMGATTPLTAHQETVTFQSGSHSFEDVFESPSGLKPGDYIYTSDKNGWSFNQAVPPAVVSDAVAKAEADATGRYYSKIQDIQKSVQGQVMALELKQTVQLLKNPFTSGVAVLKALLNNASTFRGPVRRSSELWLQYRFGILPLISDIEGIKKALSKVSTPEFIGSERVYAVRESATTDIWTGADQYGVNLKGNIVTSCKAESIIRFGYHHSAKSAFTARTDDLAESFLNIRDLPSTAWEVIPYSFLIDYFLNVGSILNAATTYTGDVVWTSRSTVTTCTTVLTVSTAEVVNKSVYRLISFNPSVVTRKIRRVNRTTAPPGIPALTFELPGSNIKLANIAALLGGLLKGK